MAQEQHKTQKTAFRYNTHENSITKETDVSKTTKKTKARIKCEVCGRHFKSEGILKRHHEERHIGKRKYICDNCQISFYTKVSIYLHMVTVHSAKLHQCQHCPNNYKSEHSLWRHLLQHIDKETIKEMRTKKPSPKPKCDRCNKEFTTRSSLKQHNIHVHATVKEFSCDICAKKFASRKRIELHMVTHNSEKLYHCGHCNRSYKRKHTLNKHLLTHRVGYNPYVFCKICRKEVNKRSLSSHMVVHSNVTQFCDICNKGFKHKTGLKKHKETHGMQVKLFECHICHNRFTARSSLRIHAAVHTKEKRFRCNVCNKRFVYSASLNTHKRIHNGIKTYVCKTCGTGFAAHNTLVNHERIHTNAKPYTCDLCKRVYRRKQSIVEHMVQHTGIVIYCCSSCNLEFVTLNESIMHKNTHKRRERIICNACGKGFNCKETLLDHLATHRDMKRPCHMCDQVFIGKLRLYRHIKESHKELLMI